MKIILVITNSNGKNILFITDNGSSLTLNEAISLAEKGEIIGIHVVYSKKDPYLRANPNITTIDNLDSLTISTNDLLKGINNYSFLLAKPEFAQFEKIRCENIKEALDNELIKIEGVPKKTISEVKNHLEEHKQNICEAAKYFNIDKNILGAIMIDEFCRKGIDDLFDWVGTLGIKEKAFLRDTSVGIMQVKFETAYELIEKELYNPNPSGKKNISRAKLYLYLCDSKHNLYFAAARIRQTINKWSDKGIDISNNSGVLGTRYSRGIGTPTTDPFISPRGLQIQNEFYSIAKDILEL